MLIYRPDSFTYKIVMVKPKALCALPQFYLCIQRKLEYNTVNNNICLEITIYHIHSNGNVLAFTFDVIHFTIWFNIHISHFYCFFTNYNLVDKWAPDRQYEWMNGFLFLFSFGSCHSLNRMLCARWQRGFISDWCGVLSKSVYEDSLLIWKNKTICTEYVFCIYVDIWLNFMWICSVV